MRAGSERLLVTAATPPLGLHTDDVEELRRFLEAAIVHRPTLVTSGRTVQSYISGPLMTADARALELLGTAVHERAMALEAEFVAGEETASIPLLVAASLHGHARRAPLRYVSVRKHHKDPFGWLSTPVPTGARALLVDDVAGLGQSLLRTSQRVGAAGLSVVGALAVIDRCDGASQALAEAGIAFQSLFVTTFLR